MMHKRPLFPLALPLTLTLLGGVGIGASCGGDGGSGGNAGNGGTGGTEPLTDRNVVVLFTSDEHSHMFAFAPELDDYPLATAAGSGTLVGGFARRATLLAKERKAAKDAGKSSVTLSAGDNHMGGLPQVTFDSSTIDFSTMKALDYDVTTLGNHELDFGVGALAKSIKAAKEGGGLPAIVASNIHFSDIGPADDALAALYSTKAGDSAPMHPYTVITTDNKIKIGVIGYMGANAERVATNKKPLAFSAVNLAPEDEGNAEKVLPEIYKDLQPVVDTLRNTEKVHLVIALGHAGIQDSSTDEAAAKGEDGMIAANVSGIDLIISGHQHNPDPRPMKVKNAKSGRDVLILNGSYYGKDVGRVDIMVHADGSAPTWDTSSQALVAVDDKIVPDADQAKAVDERLTAIEKASYGSATGSFLAGLLSRATGKTVTDDATKPGDLYFYKIGTTDFDVADTHSMLALSADSMLAAADAWGAANGKKTDLALESAGVIRGRFLKGKTGVISAADAFDVVPLGVSSDDGTLGYPLVHAGLTLVEFRAVFEGAMLYGPTNDQLDLMPAGLKIGYDLSKTPAFDMTPWSDTTKGVVRKIWLDSDHSDGFEQFDKLILDLDAGIGGKFDTYNVVTSSYIAQFAKDQKAVPQNLTTLTRADKSEIKQFEAFMGYINVDLGGTLPARYNLADPSATKRFVDCSKGCP